jgi:hypothetical protein
VNRFEPIPNIRESPPYNYAHRVIDIRVFHFIFDTYRYFLLKFHSIGSIGNKEKKLYPERACKSKENHYILGEFRPTYCVFCGFDEIRKVENGALSK